MEYTLEAIYEGGVFKPVKSPKLPEHQRVIIAIHQLQEENPNQELELWALSPLNLTLPKFKQHDGNNVSIILN